MLLEEMKSFSFPWLCILFTCGISAIVPARPDRLPIGLCAPVESEATIDNLTHSVFSRLEG